MAKVCKIQPPLVCNLRSPPTASLSTLAEHLESEAGLEDQAGSRVGGKMGSPVERRGAERLAGESEHVRAHGCASCAAACKARAPQGTPGARCTRGAEVGCIFLGYFFLGTQKEVTRPQAETLLLLLQKRQATNHKPQQRSRAEPVPTGDDHSPAVPGAKVPTHRRASASRQRRVFSAKVIPACAGLVDGNVTSSTLGGPGSRCRR